MLQPTWTLEGHLIFVSDRSGWWNLYLETALGQVKPLFPQDAEFAGPAWALGSRSYALLPDGRCGPSLDAQSCPALRAPLSQSTCLPAGSWPSTAIHGRLASRWSSSIPRRAVALLSEPLSRPLAASL